MTDEEEKLLKQYLNIDGQDFENWYHERFSSDEADWEYKYVLAEAKAFKAGRARAYREIDAILDSHDHPARCGCPHAIPSVKWRRALERAKPRLPGLEAIHLGHGYSWSLTSPPASEIVVRLLPIPVATGRQMWYVMRNQ